MDSDAPFPWPYSADLPQRFSVNYGRYLTRGGTASPQTDALGFVSGGNAGDIARFLAFTLAFDQIIKEGVAGDVAELGVYRGHTAHVLTTFARRHGRHTYLFDTFSGFDRTDFQGVDLTLAPGFERTSLEEVRAFVGTEATTYCAGHFPGTARLVPAKTTFSLVHLDCDLYAPMKSALEFFYPRMQPGGFMLIHDYSSLAWEGTERAADLFFADKPECLIPMPDSGGTAIVRRQRLMKGSTWQDRLRAALLSDEWLSAGSLASDTLFLSGWSGAEDWGRWGLGEEHLLLLYQPPDLRRDLLLELDVQTVILGPQQSQTVDLLINDAPYGEPFVFDAVHNGGVRTLRLPASVWSDTGRLKLTFRPQTYMPPRLLDKTAHDDRPLGMAINRFRLLPANNTSEQTGSRGPLKA